VVLLPKENFPLAKVEAAVPSRGDTSKPFIMTCFQQSHVCSLCHEDFQVSPAMGQYQKLKRLISDPIPSQLNPIHTIKVLTYIVMEAVRAACMQEASSLNLSL